MVIGDVIFFLTVITNGEFASISFFIGVFFAAVGGGIFGSENS